MGHLFLDIETYVSEGNSESGSNPYVPESKILVIAYTYYDTKKPPAKRGIKAPTLLKEWDLGEKKMLSNFFDFLKGIQSTDKALNIHGFNILRFDLPYLLGRMKAHNIAPEEEIHSLLFTPNVNDMMHLGRLISDDSRKKEQLWGISQANANDFFGIQTREGIEGDCSRLYDAGNYDKITDQCSRGFTFEQLLNAFYLHAKNMMDDKN